MKLAYLLAEDLSAHPGLKHKIEGQVSRWQNAGHDVYMVLHSSGKALGPDKKILIHDHKLSIPSPRGGKAKQMLRLSRQYAFAASALESIQPNITYSRYLFPTRGLKKISNFAGNLIFEINSDDVAEYSAKSFLTGTFNRLFRSKVLKKASGFVFVTQELANSPHFSHFAEERIVLANGIECDQFTFVPNPGNAKPELAFIGSPGQLWHGMDKLAALANILPECTLHVIGPNEQECISHWGKIPVNVVIHGYLSAGEADKLISKMDIGISTLALHRKTMDEACPLKVRQYLAHGLPILAASKDADISDDQDFYLRLPNCEDNIAPNAQIIRDFVYRVFGDTALRETIRNFAISNLAIERKESKRLHFFDSILNPA